MKWTTWFLQTSSKLKRVQNFPVLLHLLVCLYHRYTDTILPIKSYKSHEPISATHVRILTVHFSLPLDVPYGLLWQRKNSAYESGCAVSLKGNSRLMFKIQLWANLKTTKKWHRHTTDMNTQFYFNSVTYVLGFLIDMFKADNFLYCGKK